MSSSSSAAVEFWEPHYARSEPGTGGPNPVLVDTVRDLTPGQALDLGCGGGGDAWWLAQQGWAVLSVDVSGTALSRVADRAAGAGLAHRVRTERHDLTATFPAGGFDLISAQFLLSPVEFDRPAVFARAAAALQPGGLLLIVDHASVAPWSWADPDTEFPTPGQLLAGFGLDPQLWAILRRGPSPRTTGLSMSMSIVTIWLTSATTVKPMAPADDDTLFSRSLPTPTKKPNTSGVLVMRRS